MQPIPTIHSSFIVESTNIVNIPKSTHIEPGCIVVLGPKAELKLGERVTIYPGVTIRSKSGCIEIGDDVSIGPNACIYEMRAGLRIGSSSMIAAGVRICGVSHGTTRLDIPMREQPTQASPVVIGRDVWIGMNAVIHPGVTIGDHTIIGSGSVVTKSIESGCVAYGVPCRLVSRRTEESEP